MTNDQRISDIIERWDTKQIDGQIPSVSGKKFIKLKLLFLYTNFYLKMKTEHKKVEIFCDISVPNS